MNRPSFANRNLGLSARRNPRTAACLAQAIEPLEFRRMLSAVPTHGGVSMAPLPLNPQPLMAAADTQIPANRYVSAYGMTGIMFGTTPATGLGETIAIIDAYDETDLLPTGSSGFATSDLAEFDSLFGFPSPPQFIKVNETGGSTLPTGSGSVAQSDAVETALDVEYAHAMAPSASILLVECNSLSDSDLGIGINWARNVSGVIAVSMSFASGEYSTETSTSASNGGNLDDGFFNTPSGHTGITFISSSGDGGFGNGYPASSPNVLAAGGTVLFESNGNYITESGWAGSGGGVSAYETKPTYQSGVDNTASSTHRLVPDISLNAGQPVLMYDADGEGGEFSVEGTSIVAPALAGVTALVDQGRALEGLGSLYGYTSATPANAQFLARAYGIPSADYRDITTGSSGTSALAKAGPGYDLVTGIGTPIGAKFVPDLAGGVTVSGTVFNDANNDGIQDNGEAGMSGVQVFIDLNNSGSFVSGDPTATTNSSGQYSFQYDVAGGKSLIVRETVPSNYNETTASGPSFTSSYAATPTENFGNIAQFPSTVSGNPNYYVRLDPTSTNIQIYAGTNSSGTLLYSQAKSIVGSNSVTFQNSSGSGDQLVIDYTNGDPMSASGQFAFQPAGGSTNAKLTVEGTPSSSTITINSSGLTVNSQAITTSNLVTSLVVDAAGSGSSLSVNFTSNPFSTIALNAQASNDSITLSGTNTGSTTVSYAFTGSSESLTVSTANPYTISGDAAMGATNGVALTDSGAGQLTLDGDQTLSSFSISGTGAGVLLGRTSGESIISATSLSIDVAHNAYLDLDDNGMAINYSGGTPLPTIDTWLGDGYAGGNWNGPGIRSTAAANDGNQATGIGSLDNQDLLNVEGSNYSSFLGVPVSQNSVLLRYTYYGDTDLNGTVDGTDVTNLQQGASGGGSGWMFGDFNYDNSVDGTDVTLLVQGFNDLGSPLP